jgi:hypothetical protein
MYARVKLASGNIRNTPLGSSLGLAYYKMIGSGSLHTYHSQAAENNGMLIHFFPNIQRVIEKLGECLEGPEGGSGYIVKPRSLEYWGLCGFAVVNTPEEAGILADLYDSGEGIHADYEGLSPYPHMMVDHQTFAYSAIISVAQPERLGGLKIFKKRLLANEFDDQQADLVSGKIPSVQLTYEPGMATVFDSFLPHAIIPPVFSEAHPERIVLVVHYLYQSKPFPHFECWY